jgi:hypothetical protein
VQPAEIQKQDMECSKVLKLDMELPWAELVEILEQDMELPYGEEEEEEVMVVEIREVQAFNLNLAMEL